MTACASCMCLVCAPPVWWYFEVAMSLTFLTDLVVAFNTAYRHAGMWITSRAQIAKRYLTGWSAAPVGSHTRATRARRVSCTSMPVIDAHD